MKQKKYFCYEIFKNLSVWSSNGQIGYSPCSVYNGYYEKSDQIDIDQAWYGPGRKKLIDMVDKDIPIPGCERCYQAENNGLVSRRQHSQVNHEQWHKNTNIDLPGPQSLTYSVGNLCNLKCIICGPQNSTQWIPDYQKLYPEQDITFLKYQKNSQLEITNEQSLTHITGVHFHGGGEPLLSDAHVNLLQLIKQAKGLGDVRVFYNTNGTVTVTDQILKLWEECKLIELYFSVDDINQRFEYQRPGCDFSSIEKNLQWYYNNMPHNHLFKVNTVWSYLNLFYLDQLFDWKRNTFDTNRYGDPTPLIFQAAIGKTHIAHVSEKIKSILQTKFAQYPELIAIVELLSTSSQPHDQFFNWIQRLDAIRNQSFSIVAPEWAKLLHDH